MRSAGVIPCKQALCHHLVNVVPVVAKHSFHPGNLEHVTLYFDNLVDKKGTMSMIFNGIFLLHCEYMHVQVDS